MAWYHIFLWRTPATVGGDVHLTDQIFERMGLRLVRRKVLIFLATGSPRLLSVSDFSYSLLSLPSLSYLLASFALFPSVFNIFSL